MTLVQLTIIAAGSAVASDHWNFTGLTFGFAGGVRVAKAIT